MEGRVRSKCGNTWNVSLMTLFQVGGTDHAKSRVTTSSELIQLWEFQKRIQEIMQV